MSSRAKNPWTPERIEYQRERRAKRIAAGVCYVCGKNPKAEDTLKCEPCITRERSKNKYSPDRNLARKLEVFNAYGGPKCNCCGEATLAFLSLDHINNDGAKHRKQLKTTAIYAHLIYKRFPPGFQVLCMNCNFGKRINGGICPHKTVVLEIAA